MPEEIENAQKNTSLEQKYAGHATSAQQTHANRFYQSPKTRNIPEQKIASVSDALRGRESTPQEVVKTQRKMVPAPQPLQQEPTRGRKHFTQHNKSTIVFE